MRSFGDSWINPDGTPAIFYTDRLAEVLANCYTSPSGHDPVISGRRGRLTKVESKLRETVMLAQLREHPTLVDNPKTRADLAEVSESTARRFIAKMREIHADGNRPK